MDKVFSYNEVVKVKVERSRTREMIFGTAMVVITLITAALAPN
jgi:hypothetical protein